MKKKVAMDMVLNTVASAIPVFALQLLILPAVAKNLDDSNYGLVVTCLSMFNVFSSTFGNSINNVRLINEYKKWKSYNYELMVVGILNVIIITAFSVFYYGRVDLWQIILNIVVGLLWYLKDYLIVSFRININYFDMVKSNVFLTIGYIAGFGLFLLCRIWQLIYILGFLCCLIFIIIKSDLWKERIVRSNDFRDMFGQTMILLLATVLYRIPTYADKMIAYPVLGARNTSILYIATLFGKIVSMVVSPVSGVILSYLAKVRNKDNSVFRLALFTGCIIGILGYFVCLLITRPLLGIIYPDYVNDVMGFVPITTGTVILTALIGIVDPFLINYFSLRWQVLINSLYAVFYLVLSISLMRYYSLYGFCIGALITEGCKLTFEVLIFYRCKDKG